MGAIVEEAERRRYRRERRRVLRRIYIQDRLRVFIKKPGGLPGLIVAGAQKSGTSSLHFLLSQHPEMRGVRQKEVHFFDDNYHRGPRWYRTFFPPSDGRLFFEATPDYLPHPYAAARIAETLPEARIVALLREPVSRALSHYWMAWMAGTEPLEIEAAFEAEERRLAQEPDHRLENPRFRAKAKKRYDYVRRGLYAEQLERFFAHHDRTRLLVIRAEDFSRAPQATLDAICDFAAIRRFTPQRWTRMNQSRVGDVRSISPPGLQSRLAARFSEPNARLRALTGIHWDDLV